MFCEVVVPRTPLDELTYYFEPGEYPAPEPGDLVLVRLRNRQVLAVVFKVGRVSSVPEERIQPVLKILMRQAVPSQLLTLARWVADYYVCHLGDVLGLIIPSRVQKKFTIGPEIKEAAAVREIAETTPMPLALARAVAEGRFGVWVSVNEDNCKTVVNRFVGQALNFGSVLILMPEVELSHWLVVLGRCFGEQMVEYHHRMTPKQRRNAWFSLLTPVNKVVVGVRSAVWAPVQKLAGVVVLAEHSGAFKEERKPNYNARDVAITRAKIARCPVLLIDSTPSAETWWNIQNRRFIMLKAEGTIPAVRTRSSVAGNFRKGVYVVDMRLHKEEVISPRLFLEFNRVLNQGKTALGYINRRGLSRLVVCSDCGGVLRCPHCHLPGILTAEGRLICSLCGWEATAPDQCPVCQGTRFRFRAPGVEMVVRELKEKGIESRVFKGEGDAARVLVGTRGMLRSFSSQNQELTDVGLIALINFDTEFALPDFRNRERAFTLLFRLLQQAQRNQARVVIQTYRPDDPVLSFALAGDMAGFMNWELKMRQEPGFPPYRRLVAINIKAQDEKTLRQETGVILARFKNLAGVVPSVTAGAFEVLGPAFSSTFSARIILKLPRQVLPGKVIDLNWLEKLRVRVRVDVDPVKILPF